MAVAICTLFEGHYHYGMAALVNSLYKNGFRGSIYGGFKGTLPAWTSSAKKNPCLQWEGATTLQVGEHIQIHFLPIVTEYHLTNYKPFFMLKLWAGVAKDVGSIVYFDPDIIVKCKWEFYEKWIAGGVALVHEISANDMPPTHPLRKEWEKVIKLSGRKVNRQLYSYINGGFCGVSKENIDFLHAWIDVFKTGIAHFNLTPGQWAHSYDRTYLFYAQDQDALNIAAMCTEASISEMGPEAMDFIPGGSVMSHSVGPAKPWRKRYLSSVFRGYPPSSVDKLYWSNVTHPINCFKPGKVKVNRASIRIASLIGRFYRRN